ncbi:GNAT family N-acetyltransferase [Solitalea lacus]|uniref:GNAT family N-acetyltransferase n=1 Tax=Solitalea lacus TaxID=2911172 RepID=UPI001EDB6A5B|nr:GNAT family N-acetyltransferase [Solitalea lacus]UKJ06546.1 N-acetyltransferase [Solitalea lacus]
METDLIITQTDKHFETVVDGYKAFIEYLQSGDSIYLTHTEVAPELEGKGIAKKLVETVLKMIERDGKQLVPLCPYVASYLNRHPDWKRIVAPGYNV